jgi:hypothetical protein
MPNIMVSSLAFPPPVNGVGTGGGDAGGSPLGGGGDAGAHELIRL